jgi:glycosyltransferase involved in cell wall biosynthesis
MPTVSVVIPCYKYGQYVTDCVTSLLTNTAVNLDILVIDDASPDDTWSVVSQLPRLDPRIRVRRHERNRGLIGTANAAIMDVTGDYVVLLSADDALAPGWLDRAVPFLERHPRAAFAYGPTRRFTGSLPALRVTRPVRPVIHAGPSWLDLTCRLGVTPVLSPEVLVRTSAQHEVGGYDPDLPYSSDMEMWLRLASIGDVVRVGGPVAAFYRVSPHSMSRTVYLDLLGELQVRRDAFDAWHEFAETRLAQCDSLMATARSSLARRALRRAYVAFLHDPISGQFDAMCAFALENDPAWAAPRIDRLRSRGHRRGARWLRDRLLPVTKTGVRLRHAATDIRAQLHLI